MDPSLHTRLEKLSTFTRRLGTATNFEQFLKDVISAAVELTDSEAASVLDFDEAVSALRFLSASLPHDEQLRSLNVPLDGSAAGWAFCNAKSLAIPNVNKDSRHFKAPDQLTGFTTRSLLAVPLSHRGEIIGVLEVVNKADNAHYTEDDATILETLASYAALGLWNHIIERRMQETQEESSELERIKNDFIAIASHELRTPLGLILGHATFLRETLDENSQEPLEVIIRNATKLKDIVESLTNVDNYRAGVATARQHSVFMTTIADEVVAAFQDMADRKNITIRVKRPEQDLPLEADAKKVTVALSNLLRNAITFTDSDGNILIKIEPSQREVQVSVIDDGIGISQSDMPHVFERFFQVESHLTRRHSGMGLGLSVAKANIEINGGRIWVESAEGQGSKFTFVLPVKTAEPDTSQQVFLS